MRHAVPRARRPLRTLLIASCVLFVGCSGEGDPFSVMPSSTGERTIFLGDALVQTVRVRAERAGDSLDVQVISEVRNTGNGPVTVEVSLCALDIGSNMDLQPHPAGPPCTLPVLPVPVAGGATLRVVAMRRAAITTGVEVLRVRHVRSPSVWVHVGLDLRGEVPES